MIMIENYFQNLKIIKLMHLHKTVNILKEISINIILNKNLKNKLKKGVLILITWKKIMMLIRIFIQKQ